MSSTDNYGTAQHASNVKTLHKRRPLPEVGSITYGRSVAILADPWSNRVQQPSAHKYVGGCSVLSVVVLIHGKQTVMHYVCKLPCGVRSRLCCVYVQFGVDGYVIVICRRD